MSELSSSSIEEHGYANLAHVLLLSALVQILQHLILHLRAISTLNCSFTPKKLGQPEHVGSGQCGDTSGCFNSKEMCQIKVAYSQEAKTKSQARAP